MTAKDVKWTPELVIRIEAGKDGIRHFGGTIGVNLIEVGGCIEITN